MNSEIKEILDKINCALKIYERDKKLNQVSPKSIYFLSPKEQQILLDYITNLQEEVKSANESITWWTNRFNAIQRDNKELNKEKSILEKSLKLIWKKDIKIDYEKLDKANKDIEKELKEGDDNG